ncbi:hypothetical protein EJB05_31510, partial [Eragrostis curvula]
MAVLMQSVTLLLLLPLSLLISSLTLAAAEARDEAALLTFKAAAGGSDALASWNSTTAGGFCSWEGVRCRGRHRRVVALNLPSRRLTGILSPAIGNLSSLRTLNLSFNGFRGDIPASLGRLHRLHVLDLSRNTFSGEFPINLTSCINLKTMYIRFNQLHGRVPSEIGDKLMGLRILTLANNNLTGTIPASLGNLSSLTVLELSFNQLEGIIPSSLGNIRSIQYLHLAFNNLSGEPPLSLYNLSSLRWLQLQFNMLHGGIPIDIGRRFTSMRILRLYHNQFTGPIPASLSNLTTLQDLHLGENILNGYVPRTLGRLPYNLLSEPLPSEFGGLRNLNYLSLTGNQLSGKIPDGIEELVVLQELWLDNNSFEGSIPQSLTNIKGLSALSLSMNKLSGSIPVWISNISNLQQLYLAHNNLSGPIPIVLQNSTSLSKLDLSFNNLQGEVPIEGIFRNLANLSIAGNIELCGGMPQLHLPPCQMNSIKINRKRKFRPLKIALATIAALLLLASIIALIQLINKKLRQKQKSPFPPLVEEQYERVSYHALANGTDGFSEANLLGRGSFGAVYKCTFQDEATTTAVKVFNPEQSGSTKSFVAECEALRRVRHRCLLKIITCCSSINHQGQEFKALVFEFMHNGSLNEWLHPQSGIGTLRNTLNLEQRLDIAVDILDALDYLHNHCQPAIVHCDLKPSNILLAQDMSARVGDFGISKILPECVSETLQNSNSTIGIRGPIGYVAPEYGEGSPVSTLGDVYSLGILLLEMFTGKSPTDDMFRGQLDLHKFAEDALPNRIWDIVDSTMWLDAGTYDNTTRTKTESCLASVIALGISCSKKQPKERTLVHNAAAEMHAIRDSYLIFARSVAASE